MEHAISLLQVVKTCAPLGKSVRSSIASLTGTCHATTQRCGFSQMLIYIALLLLASGFRSVVRSIYHPSRHESQRGFSQMLVYIALLLLARDFRGVVRSIYHPSRHESQRGFSQMLVYIALLLLARDFRGVVRSIYHPSRHDSQRGFSQMLVCIALLLLARDFRGVVRSICHPSQHDTRTTRSDLYKMLLPSVELATGNKPVAATQAGAVHDNSDHFANFTNSQLSHPARPQNGGTENEKQPTPLERNKTRSLPLIL